MDNARQWFIEVIMYEKKTRLLLVSLIIVTVILLACEALLGCHFLTSFTVWFILLKAALFSFKTLPMIAFVVEWFLHFKIPISGRSKRFKLKPFIFFHERSYLLE